MTTPAYEKADVAIKGIVWFITIMAVTTGLIMVLMAWMFGNFEQRMAKLIPRDRT